MYFRFYGVLPLRPRAYYSTPAFLRCVVRTGNGFLKRKEWESNSIQLRTSRLAGGPNTMLIYFPFCTPRKNWTSISSLSEMCANHSTIGAIAPVTGIEPALLITCSMHQLFAPILVLRSVVYLLPSSTHSMCSLRIHSTSIRTFDCWLRRDRTFIRWLTVIRNYHYTTSQFVVDPVGIEPTPLVLQTSVRTSYTKGPRLIKWGR